VELPFRPCQSIATTTRSKPAIPQARRREWTGQKHLSPILWLGYSAGVAAGRNDPCPCRSGKKFKKCCGDPSREKERAEAVKRHAAVLMERRRCDEIEREKQQGLGRPIISAQVAGTRFVAIGDKLVPGKWKTFVDFLFFYLTSTLTEEWRAAEAAKPPQKQHPLLKIFRDAATQMNSVPRKPGDVASIKPTGDAALVFDLAYSLYLLEHNQAVQSELLRRIKAGDQFDGALYESIVCGILIRAGYHLEFENERDVSRRHCELTATCNRSGKKFSVEAKRRQPGKANFDVGNQLYAALVKPAHHPRIVFIELNVRSHRDESEVEMIVGKVTESLNSRESRMTIKDAAGESQPAPPAYVIITNHPFSYGSDEPFLTWAAIHGFKIPDMKGSTAFPSIREAYHARQRHREVRDILKSFNEHSGIPTTFDGTPADISFRSSIDRLRVGDTYLVPDKDGNEVNAVIQSVTVIENTKSAFALCRSEHGENMIVRFPLTDGEFAGYKKYPETFFGEYQPKPESNDPVDLFEWLLNSYRQNTKAKLLVLMNGAPDIEHLNMMEQQELVEIFCERTVMNMLAMSSQKKGQTPEPSD
jgi:hypothetical protein